MGLHLFRYRVSYGVSRGTVLRPVLRIDSACGGRNEFTLQPQRCVPFHSFSMRFFSLWCFSVRPWIVTWVEIIFWLPGAPDTSAARGIARALAACRSRAARSCACVWRCVGVWAGAQCFVHKC